MSVVRSRAGGLQSLIISEQRAARLEVLIGELSNEVGGGSPKDFADFIDSESVRWSKLVKERNIKLE